jgi:uncharacterized membrane protein YeaQ/YmgE (transglycosylase-associated protein family)
VNAQGQGVELDIVLGIVGALVRGYIFDAAGGVGVTGFNAWSLLVAIIGSIMVPVSLSCVDRASRPVNALEGV